MMLWVLLVVALLVVGLTLVLIEVFTPGFAVIGITGVAMSVAAVVLAFVKLGPLEGVLALLGGVAGAALIVSWFRKSRTAKQLVLEEVQEGKAPDPKLALLAGQMGRVVTPLRPSGTARIAQKLVDVVTEGVYVEPGTEVRVSRVEGGRVVVEPVTRYAGGQ
ncbi:MAG: hypothetical protein HYZ28_10230 [Myxococcales bacterium]|nr:hypothetical protein [Myxococcales bacterium]